ncbi:Protein of unknown function [Cotesia congregata]|uniref:Uncharacterized protein n=1 Tax=Cotesia congregata TaxID=51543 RepID=A0A8J2MR80_COTCN|nr:Protein of unknown function [Cotesia congregata]
MRVSMPVEPTETRQFQTNATVPGRNQSFLPGGQKMAILCPRDEVAALFSILSIVCLFYTLIVVILIVNCTDILNREKLGLSWDKKFCGPGLTKIFMVPPSILKNLATEISQSFDDKSGIYYSPGLTDGTNKINPTGKLQSQLNYARKQLVDSGLLVISSRRNSVLDSSTDSTSTTSLLNLLKKDSDDLEKIEKAWIDTFSARKQLVADSIDKLVEFSLYPCLSGEKGADFVNDKDAVIISLLPLAIKSSISSTVKRRKVENHSVADEKTTEFKNSYILTVEKSDELEAKIKARRQTFIINKEAFYPFMVFVGPVDFYVIIDNVKLKVNTALEALDVTFKIFLLTSCTLPKFITEKYLKVSAAEALCVICNIGVLIGHFIPVDDLHWKLYIYLIDIIDIVTSTIIHDDLCDYLQRQISEYLRLLTSLFPNCMKPKHHFLLHYSRVMKLMGPLWNLNTMRAESKNKEAKVDARTAVIRRSICKTIAIKHQLHLSYRFALNHQNVCKYDCEVNDVTLLKGLPQYPCYCQYLSESTTEHVYEIKLLKFKARSIKIDSILMIPTSSGPTFFTVFTIFHDFTDQLFIVTKNFSNYCNYDEHYQAYEIHPSAFNDSPDWNIIGSDDLESCCVIHITKAGNNKKYILKRWV